MFLFCVMGIPRLFAQNNYTCISVNGSSSIVLKNDACGLTTTTSCANSNLAFPLVGDAFFWNGSYFQNQSSGNRQSTNGSPVVCPPTCSDLTNPGSISGGNTFCNFGTTLILQSSAASGGSGSYIVYQWQSSSNGFFWTDIPGAGGSFYSPPIVYSTTHYRRKAKRNDCGSWLYSNSVSIVVNSPPSLDQYISVNSAPFNQTNTVTICQGSSVLFDLGGSFGNDWTITYTRPDGTVFNGGANGSANDQIFIPNVQDGSLNEGTWTVNYTDPNGCSGSGTFTLNVNPIPNPGQFISVDNAAFSQTNSVSVCEGQSVLFDLGGAFGNDWIFTYTRPDGTTIPGGANGVDNDQILIPNVQDGSLNEGSWTVNFTDPNGCSNSATFTIAVNPLPNPVQFIKADNNP
ncbi:MAG: hypothetical protein AAFR61_30490, partial [Bacteroidota bacterium]